MQSRRTTRRDALLWGLVAVLAVSASIWQLQAQAPAGRGAGAAGAAPQIGGRAGRGAPPVDPAILERGRGLYAVNCGFCHGSEARGGESGTNLLRSPVLLEDQKGSLLVPFVKAGRPDRGMPPRPDLTDDQIRDIAIFLSTLRTSGRDPARNRPATIVVGNAAAGRTYFEQTCARCHSTTGDLQGLATRYPEPRQLQQAWLSGTSAGGRGGAGGRANRTRIIVTLPSGEKVEGTQARLDDFIVSLQLADGSTRTFVRDGDVPKLEIHDPLQPHRELVPTYTDRDIHDLTAYLVTLK
jgi:mono/diheme cytochrome c family protein